MLDGAFIHCQCTILDIHMFFGSSTASGLFPFNPWQNINITCHHHHHLIKHLLKNPSSKLTWWIIAMPTSHPAIPKHCVSTMPLKIHSSCSSTMPSKSIPLVPSHQSPNPSSSTTRTIKTTPYMICIQCFGFGGWVQQTFRWRWLP